MVFTGLYLYNFYIYIYIRIYLKPHWPTTYNPTSSSLCISFPPHFLTCFYWKSDPDTSHNLSSLACIWPDHSVPCLCLYIYMFCFQPQKLDDWIGCPLKTARWLNHQLRRWSLRVGRKSVSFYAESRNLHTFSGKVRLNKKTWHSLGTKFLTYPIFTMWN